MNFLPWKMFYVLEIIQQPYLTNKYKTLWLYIKQLQGTFLRQITGLRICYAAKLSLLTNDLWTNRKSLRDNLIKTEATILYFSFKLSLIRHSHSVKVENFIGIGPPIQNQIGIFSLEQSDLFFLQEKINTLYLQSRSNGWKKIDFFRVLLIFDRNCKLWELVIQWQAIEIEQAIWSSTR